MLVNNKTIGESYIEMKDLQKGKTMATVRFAYHYNSKRYYKSLSEAKNKEWSGFMRSFKGKQRQE